MTEPNRQPASVPTGPTSQGSVSQRVPRGTPAGGQFAPSARAESTVTLDHLAAFDDGLAAFVPVPTAPVDRSTLPDDTADYGPGGRGPDAPGPDEVTCRRCGQYAVDHLPSKTRGYGACPLDEQPTLATDGDIETDLANRDRIATDLARLADMEARRIDLGDGRGAHIYRARKPARDEHGTPVPGYYQGAFVLHIEPRPGPPSACTGCGGRGVLSGGSQAEPCETCRTTGLDDGSTRIEFAYDDLADASADDAAWEAVSFAAQHAPGYAEHYRPTSP